MSLLVRVTEDDHAGEGEEAAEGPEGSAGADGLAEAHRVDELHPHPDQEEGQRHDGAVEGASDGVVLGLGDPTVEERQPTVVVGVDLLGGGRSQFALMHCTLLAP